MTVKIEMPPSPRDSKLVLKEKYLWYRGMGPEPVFTIANGQEYLVLKKIVIFLQAI
jgi:hypothetical protein